MPNQKLYISIFIVWLFHLSGIIGIHLGYTDFFLSKSWFTLTLSSALLLYNSSGTARSWLLVVVCLVGFGAEVAGVNTGMLFGSYTYGENLGFKLWGVPLVIGLNWLMLGMLAHSLAVRFITNTWLVIMLSAFFMVLIDLIIEPVAPKFNYWQFEGGLPKIHNYIGWFVVALPVQWLILKSEMKPNQTFALNLVLAQLVFFLAFWYA